MATTDTSVTAIRDPSTLPQVAFARADDLLTGAAKLRAKAEILKAQIKEYEAKAEQFEESAAELQATAEEDRDHVQAELDNTLNCHGDVLVHFLLIPENEEELKRLTTSVEEGRAYVHEVMTLGEKLLQVKAAKLQSSHQARRTPLAGLSLSETEGSAVPFPQIASQILAPLRRLTSSAASTESWQRQLHGLFGRRVPDVGRPAYASLIQPEADEGPDEAQKEINALVDKVETHDSLGPSVLNIAKSPSTRSDTSVNSISTEALENALLPIPNQSLSVEADPRRQEKRKRKNAPTEKTAVSTQDVYHSHVDEDSIPPEASETGSPNSKKLKREAPGSEIAMQNVGRRKKVRKPPTRDKVAAFYVDKALSMYRELLASGTGKGKARKVVEREIKKIENSSKIFGVRKKRLLDYGRMQIRATANREANRVKNAATERWSKLEVTEEEKAAFFNEPNMLARYRELFTAAKGNDWDKSAKAKKVLRKEMNHNMQSISEPRKPKVFMYVKQQVNAMVKRETERMLETHPESFRPRRMNELDEMSESSGDDAMVEGEKMRRESAQAEDPHTAGLFDEPAENAVETEWSEHRQYAQLEDLYAAELSDESMDEAMWP